LEVQVADEVWQGAAVDPLDLVAILGLCDARRHILKLHPKGRAHATAWIEAHTGGGLRARLLDVLRANQSRAPNTTQGNARITVVADTTDWTRARLTPPLAARLLRRPLKLLVENSRNDRAFLLQLAEPSSRRELQKALEAGWIEFEMGGGLQEIHHRLRSLTAEVGATPDHAMIELARLWVMFDRDAHPEDPTRESERSRQVREQAARLTTPWPLAAHQLERRAIENYVPPRVIREWWCARAPNNASRLDRERRAEAFLAANGLSDDARRSYNMKKGLLGDVVPKRRKEIRGDGPPLDDTDLHPLFRGLPPQVRDGLAAGGFDDLAAAFGESGVIRDSDLHHEVDRSERRRLVASIQDRM